MRRPHSGGAQLGLARTHRRALHSGADRVGFSRVVLIGLAGGLAVYLAARVVLYIVDPQTSVIISSTDAHLYREAGQRILAGGPIYPAFELAGPYSMAQQPELYPPPTMLLLVAPMAALPAFVWWLVPLSVIAAVVIRHRPSLVGWIAIQLCLAWPNTGFVIASGNPVLWAAAFVAVGTIWKGPAVLVLVKPSLAPFALIGVRSRGWWFIAAVYAAVSAAMWPLWLDYADVLRNGQLDLMYSIGHIPLMLIPAFAALASRSERRLDVALKDGGVLPSLPTRPA